MKKGEHLRKKNDSSKEKWRWIKHLAKEDMPILTVAATIGLFIAILGLSTAIFTQKLIAEFLPDEDSLKLFTGLVLLTILLLARYGLFWIRQIFLIRSSS